VRDVAVVIPAGGLGRRLGGRTPKQFLRLGEEPILARTVEHFTRHPRVARVVVAAPATHLVRARRALAGVRGHARVTIVAGGAERQESVWLGLQAVPGEAAVIVVHDGVRPFVTRAVIDRAIAAARVGGAAICALPITETVKRVRESAVETTVDRSGLWAVQTPQAFRAHILREAHEKARRDGFLGTDESMLVERLGQRVTVVPGLADNVKITTPEDLIRAKRATRAGGRSPRAKRATRAGGRGPRAKRATRAGARSPRAKRATRAGGRSPRAKRATRAGGRSPGARESK
jgi:2-C-methyl-D-erythritol 4-phosphate cytidylyltransferase